MVFMQFNEDIFMKKSLLALALCAPVVFANTNSSITLSDEQVNAGICIVATQGIYTANQDRQAGLSKAAAKKNLDNDLKKLSKFFNNQAFLHRIAGIWYRGLDSAYQSSIMASPEERTEFVSVVTDEAMRSCVESLIK